MTNLIYSFLIIITILGQIVVTSRKPKLKDEKSVDSVLGLQEIKVRLDLY